MNDNEIKDFITVSEKATVKEYADALKAKVDSLDAKNERILLLLLLAVVSYFLIKESLISQVNLGVVELKSTDIGLIAIPPVFSFLLFFYVVLNAHKSKVLNTCKVLTHYYYWGEVKKIEEVVYEKNSINLYIPFSVFGEINNVNLQNGKMGCLSSLMFLPIISLIILPFWFLYHSLSYLYFEYWDQSAFVQPAFAISCWLTLATVIFFIKLVSPTAKSVISDTTSI